MIYRPENQYRCTIIRGKSQTCCQYMPILFINIVHAMRKLSADQLTLICHMLYSMSETLLLYLIIISKPSRITTPRLWGCFWDYSILNLTKTLTRP